MPNDQPFIEQDIHSASIVHNSQISYYLVYPLTCISLSARFIQSVSEMQFLGFIKPTQRKTDHVQRLTWGAC